MFGANYFGQPYPGEGSAVAGPATVSGSAATSLGGLTVASSSVRTTFGTASTPLGSLTVSSASHRTLTGTAAVSLGALAVAATGIRTAHGTAACPLGTLTVTAAGTVAHVVTGSAAAALGALTVAAAGHRVVSGSAATSLGRLVVGGIGPDFYAMLFDPTGTITTGVLSNADALMYRREVSQRGNAGLTVPLDEAGLIDFGSIVKFADHGRIRFGCRINSEATKLAVDGRKWVVFDNQPGLLSLLDQAFLVPEYGESRKSGDTRTFGPMSIRSAWYNAPDWGTPIGYPLSADVTVRKGFPVDLRPSNPMWISALGPDVNAPAGAVNHFRREFTVTTACDVDLVFTADNYLSLWLDGEELIRVDNQQSYGWKTAQHVQASLAVGKHVLYAEVTNAARTSGINPLALIGTVSKLDAAGNFAGYLLKTDTANWLVNDNTNPPGWRRGQIARKAILEAQARSAPGAVAVNIGFTDTHDSAGVAWADTPVNLAFDIATQSVADIITTLGEAGINFDFDADTMTLLAYGRMGSDKSATLTLGLGEGGGVIAYDVTASSARSTVILGHLANGDWQETVDAAGVAALGRIETGISLGTASSPETATSLARAQLAVSAHPQIGITCQQHPSEGPQLYVDWDLGDSLTVPGRRGSPMKGRGLAATVKKVDGKPQVFPEFAEDRS